MIYTIHVPPHRAVTRFPHQDPEALLAHQDFVRALARELVDDVDQAEDLSQEVMATALARPPGHQGNLRHWLAVVLRRIAANRRRSEQRRRRREAALLGASEAPSTAEVLQREELRQQVVTAVLELPEPYRGTVLLRYYEGLGTGEIARRQQLAAGTVRVRLHRGLQQLRERLDALHEGRRGAWAVPLGALLRPGTSLSLGVGVMSKKVAAAVVLLGFLVWGVALAMEGPTATGSETSTEEARELSLALKAPGEAAQAETRQTVPAPEPNEASPTVEYTLRGRCVASESGMPLPGCDIELNRLEVRQGVTTLGRVQSDAEGCFSLPLTWYPKQQGEDGILGLRVSGPERVLCTRTWNARNLAAVASLDLGDVVMFRGTQVRGRVTTPDGRGVSGRDLSLSCSGVVPGRVEPASQVNVRTDAEGRFEVAGSLRPGSWVARVQDCPGATPVTVVLEDQGASRELSIQVPQLHDSTMLRGQVVDPAGKPLKGVRVFAKVGGSGLSDAAGGFRIANRHGLAGRVELRCQKQGFAELRTETTWGAQGLRLVLTRGESVQLRVVPGGAQAPLRRFELTVWPIRRDPGTGEIVGLDGRGATKQACITEDAAGWVQLDGMNAGLYRVIVHPPEGVDCLEFVEEFRVHAGRVHRFELAQPIAVAQPVRLVFRDGKPAVGIKLELCKLRDGGLVTPATLMTGLETAWQGRAGLFGNFAQRHWEGTTGADGRVNIKARADDGYGLRIVGPGVAPTARNGISLRPGDDELRIVVDRAAEVRGTIGPPELLALFGAEAGTRAPGAEQGLPEVHCRNEAFPRDARRPIARVQPDGSFSIPDLPAGDLELRLVCFRLAGRPWLLDFTGHLLAMVRGLEEGEVRELDIDLSGLRPANLEATVRINGEVCTHRVLVFEYFKAGQRRGELKLRTDHAGRIAATLLPGSYRVNLLENIGGLEQRLCLVDELALRPGQKLVEAFALQTGGLQLRWSDPNTRPASVTLIRLDAQGRQSHLRALLPDADGTLRLPRCPPGEWRILAGDKMGKQRSLGKVTVQPGKRAEHDL